MLGDEKMKKWLRKSLVVGFTMMTFGLVTPPSALTMEPTKPNAPINPDIFEKHYTQPHNVSFEDFQVDVKDSFVDLAMSKAEILAFEKFGTRIGPVIEDEFKTVILPRIEEVIQSISEQYPNEELEKLIISEQATGGNSEKIFHIYNEKTGNDIIRFHVRRDNPPQNGYWFNFHYHSHHDSFQTHHELGEIFWAKNTPPKWMS
jgi:hypothetical protein